MKVVAGIGYWILQLTWGIIMNIIGIFATLFSIIFLKGKLHVNGYGFITEVGGNWGGVSLGAFALCGSYSQIDGPFFDEDLYENIKKHEFGHSLQNCILGPLFPFLVSIPSAIRYWLDYYGKLKSDYYSIWFEKYATVWGIIWIDKINSTKS